MIGRLLLVTIKKMKKKKKKGEITSERSLFIEMKYETETLTLT